MTPAAKSILNALSRTAPVTPIQAVAIAFRIMAGHSTPSWEGGPLCHWTPLPHTRRELRNLADELDAVVEPFTDDQLTELFRQWWAQSYPTPPGTHALLTHIGWARFLLDACASKRQRV